MVAQAGKPPTSLVAALPELRIGLVHGRMKPAEKQMVMRAFKQGEVGLLVATTVIEVGVDVPNASLMIVENAERLGLAVAPAARAGGRGSAFELQMLLYQPPLSAMAKQRLETLRETSDGFRIAEKDRNCAARANCSAPRQTGLAAFRVADLARDADLLRACDIAERLLAESRNWPIASSRDGSGRRRDMLRRELIPPSCTARGCERCPRKRESPSTAAWR